MLSPEECLARLAARFAVPAGEPHAQRRSGPDGEAWQFDWVRHHARGSTSAGHAEVDAVTGRVRRFDRNLWDDLPARPAELAVSPAEARAAAVALLAETFPDILPDLMPWEWSAWPLVHRVPEAGGFAWVRRYRGLPFPGDPVTIAIDRRTGLCVHLEAVWHPDLRGSPPDGDIGPEAALRVFRDQVGVELWYAPWYTRASPRHREPTGWTLLWRPIREGTLVRPADGAVLDAYGDPLAFPPAAGPGAADTRPALPWDRATAGRWLRDALEIPAHWVELAPFPFPRAAGAQFRWGAHPMETEFVSAEVDLNLGLVRRAQRQTSSAGPTVTLGPGRPGARPELIGAAGAVVGRVYPHLAGQLRYRAVPTGGRVDAANLQFARAAHGITVGRDGVRVTLGGDGRWLQLDLDWSRAPVPAPQPAVTREQALATLMDGREAVLSWTVPGEVYPRPRPGDVELVPVYRLLYRPGAPEYLDAGTGQPVDEAGANPAVAAAARDRLLAHPQGPPLAYFLERRWMVLGNPDPDRPATREDLLFMLASRGGHGPEGAPAYADVPAGSALAEAVGMAGAQGIVRRGEIGPDLNPAATVTRIELCRWAARSLGLASLAAAGLAVKFPWADGTGLPDEDRRAATFLHAMGLLPWTGRRLGPRHPATLGEAAQVLFAAAQHGAG